MSDSVSHTHTHKYRQLPHAPENPIAVLSASEKRAINLTWAQAFDGNSPLIRYILEVSENSKAPVSPSAPRVAQMHLLCLVSHFKSNIVTSYSLEELICCPSYYITFPWCPQNWQLRPLLPSAISLTRLPHLCASSASDPREPNCVDAGELISHFFFFCRLIKSKKWERFSPTESKSLSHCSSELRLTEKMTTH